MRKSNNNELNSLTILLKLIAETELKRIEVNEASIN